MLKAIEDICKAMTERRATLFLGSGVNAGLRNADGIEFPLGPELAALICRDLLEDELLRLTLDEAAEQARYRLRDLVLNKYIFDLFTSFTPGIAHMEAVQLPWDTIYTTNFDLLLENAASPETIKTAGEICPIVSVKHFLAAYKEEDILYYKLHGSIDVANTDEGRLILTKEDYRHYKHHRLPLFKRLRDDLSSRTLVFVGYSLLDKNFREILEDCRQEIGVGTLPLSYAVRPGFRPMEGEFWLDKYNIHLIDSTAEEFLRSLKETWLAQNYSVIPLEERKAYEYIDVDPSAQFPKYTDCFYRISPKDCKGKANPKEFFLGREPSWADIRDEVPPRRDLFWTIFETMYDELSDPSSSPTIYLVDGHAGTGKTTLIRTLAFMLVKDFDLPVLIHIRGTPLEARALRPLSEEASNSRIIVVVHDAAECAVEIRQFYIDAKRLKIPVTLLIEERTNQWMAVAGRYIEGFEPDTFELADLSRDEIERILDALTKHDALGRLSRSDRGIQIQHFTAVANKELLVALRELTYGSQFDRIIEDEYRKIPSDLARTAYAYVSALGQIDLYIRYSTLLRLLNCEPQAIHQAIFEPTQGILISANITGRSRHNIGYSIRARHPVIASIVFAAAALDDEKKYELINAVISALDLGYLEDARLLHAIVKRRDLVKTFASESKQRALYERLAQVMPENAYVFQHRSILERELGNKKEAIRFAREAMKIEPNNIVHANTLGLALEFAARSDSQAMVRQAMLSEAMTLFEDTIQRAKDNPFGYLGKIYVLRQKLILETSNERKQYLKIEILSLLETAREMTKQSPVIETEYAKEETLLGHIDEAISILQDSLEKQPTNERVRELLVRYLTRENRICEALTIANEGIKYSPTSWRLYRHIARLQAMQNLPIDVVRVQYEAAIRHNRKELKLYVELGAYLFRMGRYQKASKVFSQCVQLPVSSKQKHHVGEWWNDDKEKRLTFQGRVKNIVGGGGFVLALPQNFEAFFWRGAGYNAELVKGDKVSFYMGFNAKGPRAEIIRVHS